MKRLARLLVLTVLGVLGVSSLLNLASVVLDDPLHEARRQLSAYGWQEDDLDTTSGGYSMRPFRASALATYRSRREDRPGEVRIEIARTFPLGAWKVTAYSHEEPEGE